MIENDNKRLIDNHLEDHKKRFWDLVPIIKSYVENPALTGDKALTDHGPVHVNNVLRNIFKIIEEDCFYLNEKEKFYLFFSALMHDVGMNNYKITRKTHHTNIFNIIKEIRNANEAYGTYMDLLEDEIICDIASSHSGSAAEAYESLFNEIDDEDKCTDDDVNKPVLAMILRVADELDITVARIKHVALKTKIQQMNKESLLHWLKHHYILKWEFSKKNRLDLKLFLNDKLSLKKYKLEDSSAETKRDKEVTEKEFVNFLKKQLKKLKAEINFITENCDLHNVKTNWRYQKVKLLSYNKSENLDKENYIQIVNQYLIDGKEEPEKDDIYVDSTISEQKENDQHEEESKNTVNDYYTVISTENFQEQIDNFVKKNKMFISSHFMHKEIRLLNWLDTYKIYKERYLFKKCINIFAQHIKAREIDGLVGINFKGAKICSLLAIKLDLPFIVYQKTEMKNAEMFVKDCKSVAIITDCVITGNSIIKCMEELRNIDSELLIQNIYSIFIRISEKGLDENIYLLDKELNLSVINDSFKYKQCSIEQDDCTLYRMYGESMYDREYKM